MAVEFVSIVSAPSNVKLAVLGEGDAVALLDVALLGYTRPSHEGLQRLARQADYPITETWYTTNAIDTHWLPVASHAHPKKSGECRCGYPSCDHLGLVCVDNERVMQRVAKDSVARRGWLERYEERKRKSREYNQRRKQAA